MIDIKKIKAVWCVEAANREYLIGCLRLAQRMRYLKSKFQVIVMVSREIAESDLFPFYESNIKVLRFSNQDFLDRTYNTSSSFEPLKLIEYDFICNLEADMLPLTNIDYFMENGFDHMYNQPYNIFAPHGITGYMFFKPSIAAYLALYYDIKKSDEIYIVEWFLMNHVDFHAQLPSAKYFNFNANFAAPSEKDLAHFPTIFKPWNQSLGISDDFCKKFTELNDTEFNKFVDTTKDRFTMFSLIALLYRTFCFNYGSDAYGYYDHVGRRAQAILTQAQNYLKEFGDDIKK